MANILESQRNRFRILFLNELKSGCTIDEAEKNAKAKLEKYFINVPREISCFTTSTKIQYWFKRFNKGDISIFDKNSDLYVSIRENPNKSIDSLLFLSDAPPYKTTSIRFATKRPQVGKRELKLLKCDDRYIDYFYEFKSQKIIHHYDLFLNVKKEIELPFDFRELKVIGDDGFLLVFNKCKKLNLIKLDNENSTPNSLDSIDFNDKDFYFIHVDQLNPNKFMIHTANNRIAMGKIENEKIVLGQFKSYDGINYYVERLIDNKLQGFDYDYELKLFKFCDFNLDTMEETKIDMSIEMDDESLEIEHFRDEPHFWTKNRFYGMFPMSDNQKHMFMINLDELKWTQIQIVANEPRSMFIDSNEVLTLCVGEDDGLFAYYRLALRKPEKLENLAHLAILRQSTLFGKDKYSNYVKRLPITE